MSFKFMCVHETGKGEGFPRPFVPLRLVVLMLHSRVCRRPNETRDGRPECTHISHLPEKGDMTNTRRGRKVIVRSRQFFYSLSLTCIVIDINILGCKKNVSKYFRRHYSHYFYSMDPSHYHHNLFHKTFYQHRRNITNKH